MRITLILALLLLAPAAAGAQTPLRPRACRYVVDIDGGKVAATTQESVRCDYGGKILMTVNNLDDAKYRLQIGNFKFDSSNPAKCAAPSSAATALPINGNDGGGRFTFNVNGESTHTKKKNIRSMGAASAECFKFDILLYSQGGGTLLHTLDPDILITEPQPPPNGGNGPGGGR